MSKLRASDLTKNQRLDFKSVFKGDKGAEGRVKNFVATLPGINSAKQLGFVHTNPAKTEFKIFRDKRNMRSGI
jgi:hypothetical protein|tara:strand:+ start:246 stop:464 length:219 start_codon:yes stop_codon:yes gene_type:complete